MSMGESRTEHYANKSVHYGMGHTRRDRILRLAGSRSGIRILDVGCARGYLGCQLKKRGNYVAGIEVSPLAAQEAKSVLDKVYCFDIEQSWKECMGEDRFDCVVLGEILEHVFDPVQVLKSAIGVLNPGGEIIITTPNFMTWTNRIKFIFGWFKYSNQGMFDFGHIRWFTYRYLKEVLGAAGLKITKEEHIIFPGKLTGILKFWPSLFAFQFIVKTKLIHS